MADSVLPCISHFRNRSMMPILMDTSWKEAFVLCKFCGILLTRIRCTFLPSIMPNSEDLLDYYWNRNCLVSLFKLTFLQKANKQYLHSSLTLLSSSLIAHGIDRTRERNHQEKQLGDQKEEERRVSFRLDKLIVCIGSVPKADLTPIYAIYL